MLLRVLVVALDVAEGTDRAFSLLPLYGRARDLVLDTLLGPAEDFEVVSSTAPSSPPPTIR
jgi:hypothetical protein